MRFWKISKAQFAYDGSVIVVVNHVNLPILLALTKEHLGFEYNLNVQTRLILDIEFYSEYKRRLDVVLDKLYGTGVIGGTEKTESDEKPVSLVAPKKQGLSEEETEAIIAKLKRDRHAICIPAKTTNSIYTYGKVGDKIYELRESDHSKSNEQFENIRTLKEYPQGEPLKVGSMIKYGFVSYSTPFKTTVKMNDGRVLHFVTRKLNEKLAEVQNSK